MQQKVFRLSMEGMFEGGEAVQGSIHARRSHEKTHWRKATPLHGKNDLTKIFNWCHFLFIGTNKVVFN